MFAEGFDQDDISGSQIHLLPNSTIRQERNLRKKIEGCRCEAGPNSAYNADKITEKKEDPE